MDRIDLQIEVPAVRALDLSLPAPEEGSAQVAVRVARARAVQADRFAVLGSQHLRLNAEADGELLVSIARPDAASLNLLQDAAEMIGLTARGYHRVLRVARTLADLDGAADVGRVHMAEALTFRQRLSTGRLAA